MSDYFLGEIRLFPYNRIPADWHICDGSILQVQGNQALYSLIGNAFGGTGPTTFALPDLRGRTMISLGGTNQNVYTQVGQSGGSETTTLTLAQLPAHTHTMMAATTPATVAQARNAYYAAPTAPPTLPNPPAPPTVYGSASTTLTALNPNAMTTLGGGQPHENRQPYMALVACIATVGIYPPRD